MIWNYRVWKTGRVMTGSLPVYVIKETYYNEDDEVCGCTEGSAALETDCYTELKESLQRMLSAFDKPVLTEKGFKFAPWHNDNELKEEE